MKPGYTYFDANGNEFLYGGQFYLDNNRDGMKNSYKTKNDYLKSDSRKSVLAHREDIEQYTKYKGSFLFLKITKKNEKLIQSCKDMDELLHAFVKEEFWNWHDKWKTLDNPLKVVSEGKKIIEPDVDNGFYFETGTYYDGSPVEDWFYFEKIQ